MKSKKVAVLQSNYIPWKGYFDIINMVDLFIFHDDLQYTKQDWRNRNKIKTEKGPEWLTVPCGTNEKRLICEVELKDSSWQRKHWNKIKNCYQRTKYFGQYKDFFEEIYLRNKWTNLSVMNQSIIKKICREILNIKTIFDDSRKYHLREKKQARVLELLEKVKATEYLSGPAAKVYLDESEFVKRKIKLGWMDYLDYPKYNQLYPLFCHEVSIIDLIFNEGPHTSKYMKSFKKA